jgi:hypothetical protein
MPVIPAAREAEMSRMEVRCQPGQKVSRLHLNEKVQHVGHSCHLSYRGSLSRRTVVQAGPGKRVGDTRPYLKINNLKQKLMEAWFKW